MALLIQRLIRAEKMQQEVGSSEFENQQWQTDEIVTVHQAVMSQLLRRVYVT